MRHLFAFATALLLSIPASAERAVTEGIPSTRGAILVSSNTATVTIAGLTVSSGVVATTGTFTATGNTQYSLFASSGIQSSAGVSVFAALAVSTGITASSATLTGTGNTNYSLTTSSGINVQAGTVVLPTLLIPSGGSIPMPLRVGTASMTLDSNGNLAVSQGSVTASAFFGDGSHLSGVGGGGTVTTQGSPQAGYDAVFQGPTVLSSGPWYSAAGAASIVESPVISSVTITTATFTTGTSAGIYGQVAGSTLTWTNSIGEANGICLDATLYTSNGVSQVIHTNVLCDDAWVFGSKSTTFTSNYFSATNTDQNVYRCSWFSFGAGTHGCSLWVTADTSNGYTGGFGGSGTFKRRAHFFVIKR